MDSSSSALIKEIINTLDGWLTFFEGITLFNLARSAKQKIIEIGSWKGKSTICLALGSKAGNNVRIIAIDPHTGSEEHHKDGKKVWTFDLFKENIQKYHVDDIIDPIVKYSSEAADEIRDPFDLIFIDGAHDYDNVSLDFETYFPKLTEGGIIAFHDSTLPGVRKLLNEKVYRSNFIKNINTLDGITYATKASSITNRDKIQNRLRLFKKEIRIIVSKMIPLKLRQKMREVRFHEGN